MKPEIEFGFYRGVNFGFSIDFIRYRTITYAILYHSHKTLRTARKCVGQMPVVSETNRK